MGLVPLSRGCLNFYHIANIFFCFPFCAVCLSDKVATPNAKRVIKTTTITTKITKTSTTIEHCFTFV